MTLPLACLRVGVIGATVQPETVAYHQLPALLLNELHRQHATIQQQRQALVAQQAQIEALTARLGALEAESRRGGQ